MTSEQDDRMRGAYRAAARVLRQTLKPDEKDELDQVSAGEVVIVKGRYDHIHWLGMNSPYNTCPSLLNQTSPTTFPASCSAPILTGMSSVSPPSRAMSGYSSFHFSSSFSNLEELA